MNCMNTIFFNVSLIGSKFNLSFFLQLLYAFNSRTRLPVIKEDLDGKQKGDGQNKF